MKDGKYSGIFEDSISGKYYYAKLGVLHSGWQTDPETGHYYYFGTDFAAVDGTQVIAGVTYVFEDCILVKGSWVQRRDGLQYMWAGRGHMAGWAEIDGKMYMFNGNGYAYTGLKTTRTLDGSREKTFMFAEDGAWLGADYTGVYNFGGNLYYVENGYVESPGLIKIGEDYYYVKTGGVVVVNCTYFISRTNGLLDAGKYEFGADGKLVLPSDEPEKNGIVSVDGQLYYYENGAIKAPGLIKIGEDYYYVKTGGIVVSDCVYFISRTNGLLAAGHYTFGADGKMILA